MKRPEVPDIHFDARYGWFVFTPTGRVKRIVGEPFGDREEAISYALAQLKHADMSLHAAVVNARNALVWAKVRHP